MSTSGEVTTYMSKAGTNSAGLERPATDDAGTLGSIFFHTISAFLWNDHKTIDMNL